MGKKNQKLADLRRDDPKENNWEVPPEDAEPVVQVSEKKELTEKDILDTALTKVDPEINRADNPVWKYVVKDKEVVIVFRSGQKVRVPREEHGNL